MGSKTEQSFVDSPTGLRYLSDFVSEAYTSITPTPTISAGERLAAAHLLVYITMPCVIPKAACRR